MVAPGRDAHDCFEAASAHSRSALPGRFSELNGSRERPVPGYGGNCRGSPDDASIVAARCEAAATTSAGIRITRTMNAEQ